MNHTAIALVLFLAPIAPLHAQKQFGFDNRKSTDQPYWKASETVAKFKVAPGYEAKLVAAEPDVVNPIAFTFDERGRLWVVECFEYPKRTPKGQKPRDRIKIIEEVPGGPPKVTIWAEGKDLPIGWDLATGIEVGHGGVFLGAPPYLFFLQDTDNDGRCDKQTVLLQGFGSHDTHETLNTFQWGPDSKLYGLHGIYSQSDVDGVKLNAAVWRYDVPTKKFDIFAEGTSNPWGMDFDQHGQCFLACCVIPHLFHMVPGGTYKRQAGGSFNPYAYGLLNEICDHQHHKESGWAHAGLICLDGDHVPKEYQGSVVMGSIHGSSLKRDVLRPNGSTFVGVHAPDFLVSADRNVRPINLRWGPDASIYWIDWHDQNPCHQAAPDSWDQKHGRIYKLERTGRRPVPEMPVLAEVSAKQLVDYLKIDNPWWHRTALRILHERQDKSAIPELLKMADDPRPPFVLKAMWGLYALGEFDPKTRRKFENHENAWVRAWTIRLAGEAGQVAEPQLAEWELRAEKDAAPQVQLQLASTAARLKKQNVVKLLERLMDFHPESAKDPCLPLMLWLALEPNVVQHRDVVLEWLRGSAPENTLVRDEIVGRSLRRLASTSDSADLDAGLRFVGGVQGRVRHIALEGMMTGLKNRQVTAPAAWKALFPTLLKDPNGDVQNLARRLAVVFRDEGVLKQSLAVASDSSKPLPARIDAIRDIGLAHPPEGAAVLPKLLLAKEPAELHVEVCRALASYDNAELAGIVLSGWKSYAPAVRNEVVGLLAGRKNWANDLIASLGKGTVARTELNDNVILRIRAFKDANLNAAIEKHWGRFRDTPKELNALLDDMRGKLDGGPVSFARGKKIFEANCTKCHKFEGQGYDVGPALDGAARDIDYLIVNVIDPNRVVGQPYYMRLVERKDGRIETGLLAAEDAGSITLKQENNQLKVIDKKDIEGKVQILEKSVMPEGLSNNMTAQDFRDLVRYAMAHPFLVQVKTVGGLTSAEASGSLQLSTATFGVTGRIALPPLKNKDANIAVVAAEVQSPAAMKTRLLLGSTSKVQVFVNGRSVYHDVPGTGNVQPDQAAVEVELQAGSNEVRIQVACRSPQEALYARFWDPDRKLRYPDD